MWLKAAFFARLFDKGVAKFLRLLFALERRGDYDMVTYADIHILFFRGFTHSFQPRGFNLKILMC